MITARAWVRK